MLNDKANRISDLGLVTCVPVCDSTINWICNANGQHIFFPLYTMQKVCKCLALVMRPQAMDQSIKRCTKTAIDLSFIRKGIYLFNCPDSISIHHHRELSSNAYFCSIVSQCNGRSWVRKQALILDLCSLLCTVHHYENLIVYLKYILNS